MQRETRLTKKRLTKTCTVAINKSPSVSLRQLGNLIAEKDCGTGDGGVLVTQERTVDADAAKVDENKKATAPIIPMLPKIPTLPRSTMPRFM